MFDVGFLIVDLGGGGGCGRGMAGHTIARSSWPETKNGNR